jgi:hypothetical protein
MCNKREEGGGKKEGREGKHEKQNNNKACV